MPANKYNIQIYNNNDAGEEKTADEQYEHVSNTLRGAGEVATEKERE